MVRSFANKYNLMAKYPEHAEKISGMDPKDAATNYRLSIFTNDKTDDIPVYEFYHRKTEALPEGRYILFLEGDLVLLERRTEPGPRRHGLELLDGHGSAPHPTS